MAPAPRDDSWSVEFDTLRREKLFRHPPKDRSAYPALAAALQPHINSFNALFENIKILEEGLKDIGTKIFLDGENESSGQAPAPQQAPKRNRLSVRITELFLEKAILPPTNKFNTRNRNIYPAECRERHATYRGKLRARLEYRVNNGVWKESVRELGQVPLMVRVSRILGV
jgi:DNA-directed RNA polymerase I subunit RPA2